MTDPTAPKQHNSDHTAGLDPQEVRKDLEVKVPSLSKIPEADRVLIAKLSIARIEQFSGDIPHPKHLAAYAEIDPELVNRIFTMAETAQKHDQSIQHQVMISEVDAQRRDHVSRMAGLVAGWFALVIMMVGVVYLATNGQPILAGLFGLGGMAAIVGQFINGRSAKGIEKPTIAALPSKQSKKKK
jgi:uncharacterized membrane protein